MRTVNLSMQVAHITSAAVPKSALIEEGMVSVAPRLKTGKKSSRPRKKLTKSWSKL